MSQSATPLWTFIGSTQATELVSLRLLQKFVLSLNKAELTHLVQTYLQSKLSECNTFNANGLTVTQTMQKIFHDRTENITSQSIDKQIISKLNQNYGTKYKKKVICKIQQTNPKSRKQSKPHLLSIHPQVLAYSFQFLSFKELCRTQSVCVYFLYLNKQYPALTHYYLDMNERFCQKAMRYRISLPNSSYFKHIKIRASYCNKGDCYSGYSAHHRTKLFQFIVKRIIQQSVSTLDVLTIDVPHVWADAQSIEKLKAFSVLFYIMNECGSLNISTLIWEADCFKPQQNVCSISNMLQQTGSKLTSAFPKLTTFKHSIVENRFRRRMCRLPTDSMRKYVIVPLLCQFGSQLTSLHLGNRSDIFQTDPNMIQMIAQNMNALKILSIDIVLESVVESNNIVHHTGLRKLSVQMKVRGNQTGDIMITKATHVLKYLFSTFIGITEFEHIPSGNVLLECEEWKEVFYTLIAKKNKYSMEPLQSLRIIGAGDTQAHGILAALCRLKCFGLKCLMINIISRAREAVLDVFILNYFIQYLRLCEENHSQLQTIGLSYRNDKIQVRGSYLQAIVHVLCNLPRSVTSMQFDQPKAMYPSLLQLHETRTKRKEIESTKLVKQLSTLMLNKEALELETLSFKRLYLSTTAKKYLTFLFGFNNNIHITNNDYYLHFV